MFAGCPVGQWLQTLGDTSGLEVYSMCMCIYSLTQHGSGASSTSGNHRDGQNQGVRALLTCWVRQSLASAFSPIPPSFTRHPAQHHYEELRTPLAFSKFGQCTSLPNIASHISFVLQLPYSIPQLTVTHKSSNI